MTMIGLIWFWLDLYLVDSDLVCRFWLAQLVYKSMYRYRFYLGVFPIAYVVDLIGITIAIAGQSLVISAYVVGRTRILIVELLALQIWLAEFRNFSGLFLFHSIIRIDLIGFMIAFAIPLDII